MLITTHPPPFPAYQPSDPAPLVGLASTGGRLELHTGAALQPRPGRSFTEWWLHRGSLPLVSIASGLWNGASVTARVILPGMCHLVQHLWENRERLFHVASRHQQPFPLVVRAGGLRYCCWSADILTGKPVTSAKSKLDGK